MPKKEKFTEPWRAWAKTWQKLKSPSRPSKKNIQDYKRFLQEVLRNKKNLRVLVFGATPEIRDLLTQFSNIEVTVVDMNLEMILAMTELMKHKEKSEKESWVVSDWLRTPLAEGYFDVLMGDMILENLPKKLQSLFFKKCSKLLKRGGYFITRFWAEYPESRVYNFDEVVKKYAKKKLTPEVIEEFWSIGVFMSGFVKNNTVGTDLFFKGLRKYTRDPKVRNLYFRLLKILPTEKRWTYFHWQKEKWMLEKFFNSEKRAPESKRSIAYNWAYILKLKKK